MDFKIAREAIAHYMQAEDEFDSVLIEFFGGEPLLVFPFIKKVVEWTISREWPKDYHFLIGTNGTLLTDDIKNWLQKNGKCLTAAFSIDGNKQAHNLVRDNSYDLLYPHIPFFMENWPGQPAKMTIYAETIPYLADSVIELEEMGLFFTANIAFEDFWGSPEQKEKLLDIYNDQLTTLVDYYSERPHLYPVSKILEALPIYLCIPEFRIYPANENDCTRFCGSGHEMVTVDVDGNVYPCHRFLPWITGKNAPGNPANSQSQWQPEECSNCKVVSSCPTCAGYNWEINGDCGIRTTFHCEAYKSEVIASAKLASLRLGKIKLSEIEKFTPNEKKMLKQRIEAIWELVENGI
jgi:uncharacterized protein